jgi:hypothetical protein
MREERAEVQIQHIKKEIKRHENNTHSAFVVNLPAPRSRNVMLRNPNSAMKATDLRREAILYWLGQSVVVHIIELG